MSIFRNGYHVQGYIVRENILENEKNSRSGNIIFSQGNLEKNKKVGGKVKEFQNFPKKVLVNRLLEILFSINCKQYQKRNVSE